MVVLLRRAMLTARHIVLLLLVTPNKSLLLLAALLLLLPPLLPVLSGSASTVASWHLNPACKPCDSQCAAAAACARWYISAAAAACAASSLAHTRVRVAYVTLAELAAGDVDVMLLLLLPATPLLLLSALLLPCREDPS